MQGGDGSRAKILELYQRVVDERDHLQLTLAERDGEVAVLQASGVDRAWRYVSSESGASLDDLAPGVSIAAPTRWIAAGDGLSGLEAVYHAKPTVTTVDDSDDRLAQVKKQTLVVVGEEDATTPPFLSEELAAGIGGARLVRLAGAGHISNMERPEEFNAAVIDFFASVRP